MRHLFICVAVAVSAPAQASVEMQIACHNPRQGYLVRFNPDAKTLLVEAPGVRTPYLVQTVDPFRGGFIVTGRTAQGGPPFTAYFGGPDQSITIEGVQEDKCGYLPASRG